MNGKIEISLNGEWEYIKDTDGSLPFKEVKKLFFNKTVDGKMNLPINWELAGLHNYTGTVWFKREIFVSEKDINANGYIEFKGVDYYCEVFFNNFNIGTNTGYFNKFELSLQNNVIPDSLNSVIVKVTSPKEKPGKVWPHNKYLIKGIFNHHDCRPGGWSLEHGQDRNTGGIWNDINIYFTNLPSPNFDISTDYDLKTNEGILGLSIEIFAFNIPPISINAELWFKNKLVKKEVLLYNFGNKKVNKLERTIKLPNPKLWSSWDIGEPNLYNLVISSPDFGEYNYSIGFKNVYESELGELYLNGKKLFLRGTNIIPEQMLSSFTNERIENLVILLKEANINAVRVHAHVNRQELYDAFDKAGIVVWQDFALQWTYEKSIQFINEAGKQISKMVTQFKHHPCITYWCCHNEPGYESYELDNRLFSEIEKLDKTRIIKLYSNYEEHPYYGWYWGKKEDYFAAPMGPMVTEFGAQGIPNYDTLAKFMSIEEIEAPDWDKWRYHNYQYEQTNLIAKVDFGKNVKEYINNSQTYQSELLKTAIKYYRINKFRPITGIFQFMFIDCWESITWSVVDYFGNKKKGYYTLKKMYSPFLMIIDERQKEYMIDSFLNIDITIVNDLYSKYSKAELSLLHLDNEIKRIKNINIPENGTIHLEWELLKIPIKDYFKAGKNKIKFVLNDKKGVLAEEEIEIEVIEKKYYWGSK